MRAFFILKQGNLEPRLRRGNLLQCIEVFNLLLDAFVQDRVSQCEKTTARPDFIGMTGSFAALHWNIIWIRWW